jgi:peptide-methionine (S)-S-oxide reductase
MNEMREVRSVRTMVLRGAAVLAAMLIAASTARGHRATAPPLVTLSAKQSAVFAGGCFWGVEAVFEHLRGVTSVTSGYATPLVPTGDSTSTGNRGIAEAVRVVYDSGRISYQQLLQVFFLVAHDPTQVDRQGPDVGPRYRSIVFVADENERRIVLAYLDSLRSRKVYAAPIATQIAALRSFRIAEDYHQDFVMRHPRIAYVVVNDIPKLVELRRRYPEVYQE